MMDIYEPYIRVAHHWEADIQVSRPSWCLDSSEGKLYIFSPKENGKVVFDRYLERLRKHTITISGPNYNILWPHTGKIGFKKEVIRKW